MHNGLHFYIFQNILLYNYYHERPKGSARYKEMRLHHPMTLKTNLKKQRMEKIRNKIKSILINLLILNKYIKVIF